MSGAVVEFYTRGQVAAMFATGASPVHANTVLRWSREGVTIGGKAVKLRTVTVAGKPVYTADDLRAFMAEQEAAFRAAYPDRPVGEFTFDQALERLRRFEEEASTESGVSMVRAG